MFHIKNEHDVTLITSKIIKHWMNVLEGLTLAELNIINKIFYYYDKELDCGHKELFADMNLSSSTISKYMTKWLESEHIYRKRSDIDGRRHFYYPTQKLIQLRLNALESMAD